MTLGVSAESPLADVYPVIFTGGSYYYDYLLLGMCVWLPTESGIITITARLYRAYLPTKSVQASRGRGRDM